IELGERMCAIDNGSNAAGAGQAADGFNWSDLAGNGDHVRHQDEASTVGDSFFKRGGDLVEVLRWNRNLNELELEVFPFFALTHCGEHARVVLGGGENFVAGLEVHPHEQSLK